MLKFMLKFMLSVLMFSSVAFSQDVIVYDSDNFYYKDYRNISKRTLYHKDTNKPVNGIVRDEKNIKKVRYYYETTYVDGKKNGLEKFISKGKLSAKATYKNNFKDGMEYSIRDGKIRSTGFYKNGKETEYIFFYDYDNKIIKEHKTYKNGATRKVKYSKSSDILYDCTYKFPGLLTKKCVAYYDSGKMMAEIIPNGKKFSGYIYKEDGFKKKATKKDYTAMYNGYIRDKGYIEKRFKEN